MKRAVIVLLVVVSITIGIGLLLPTEETIKIEASPQDVVEAVKNVNTEEVKPSVSIGTEVRFIVGECDG